MNRIIEEQRVEGKRLGRNINHDPRSLAYLVKPRAALAQSKLWPHDISILDQGQIGSCTGNATVGVLGSDPYYQTVPAGLTLDETLAVALYSEATKIDPYPGAYPPQDSGSDGLSVAKAAQKRGYINGYLHCTSIDAVITALQTGPVITGISWYEGFDTPDSTGTVTISGSVRGGHEPAVIGVDVDAKRFRLVNSWGPDWGDKGYFNVGFDDYARLLSEQGDATSFVPNTAPAPTPAHDTPNAADLAYAHTAGAATRRTKAYKTWAAALGL